MKSPRRIAAREAILLRDGSRCFYCGGEMNLVSPLAADAMTIEHLLPRAHSGGNRLSNLVGAGFACNQFVDCIPLIDKIKLHDNWPAGAPRCGRPSGQGDSP